MNLRHKICALLMLALWLPYYAHCIEPHCHWASFGSECCASADDGDHGCDHHHDHGSPWGECHQHDPASPAHGALKLQPPPVLHVITAWTRMLIEPPPSQAPQQPPDLIGSGAAPPLQTFLVKTAQPVRGPSV